MARKKKLPDGIRLRGGTYHADFYAGGRRVRKRLSSNLEVATELLHQLQARADRADFGILDNDYSIELLKEEFEKYLRQTLKKESTRNRYAGCLANIVPQLSAARVSQIRPENVRGYRERRLAEGASPRTVNMEVTVLGTMLRWAASPEERKIGSNPLADFKPLPHDHPKEGRELHDTEVKRLLEVSQQPWRDIWYAYLVTGMRKAELVNLTFADIDWTNRELIVRGGSAKNHRERRIPADSGLWKIICRQRDGRKDRQPGRAQDPVLAERVQARFSREHVFVTTENTPLDHCSRLYHKFIECCEKARIQTKTLDSEGRVIEHVDLHSLRRTFATNLITSGADPESVRQLMGHKTLEMTMKIYTKIRSQTKRQALTKLTYGQGAVAPDYVVEYPGKDGFSVQNGHKTVTSEEKCEAI
jgi:integrase